MHSYFQKVTQAGEQKKRDLDVINIISDIRALKVQTKALFSLDQRKLAKKIAAREISCDDSMSSDVSPHSDKSVGSKLFQSLF